MKRAEPPLSEPTEPLSVTVQQANRLTGLSISTLYEMMSEERPEEDRLESTMVEGRRLIMYASLKRKIKSSPKGLKISESLKRAHRKRAENRGRKAPKAPRRQRET
jgi:hypothetical protein